MRKTASICFFVLVSSYLLYSIPHPVLAALSAPSGQFLFQYAQEPVPVLSSDPGEARPVGVGPVAAGGNSLTIRIGLEETGPVDIYFILSVPSLVSELFVFTPRGWQPISSGGLVPWKKGFIGNLDETILSGLSLSALPKAIYTIMLVVTPADSLKSFYMWLTDFGSSTSSIGHSGGTAADPGGASASFPEGALPEETTVSIFTHHAPTNLPAPAGGPDFPVLGGARFGPDGMTFKRPVKITIPLSSPLPSGTVVPLFMYDSERVGWRMTEFSATVSRDGHSATGQVTHFTDYIIMARDKENVRMFFGEFNGKFFDACNLVPIPTLFEIYISGFSKAFPLGGKHIYDFTAHYLQRKYACYEIVGVVYELAASRMIPDPASSSGSYKPIENETLVRETGSKGPIALVFIYDEDREVSSSKCGDYQMSFQWDVTVYLRCSQPDFSLNPPSASINVEETVPYYATLTCGGEGMAGQTITFYSAKQGAFLSDRKSLTAHTNRDGTAKTLLKGIAGPGCSSGQAVIYSTYNSCPGQRGDRIYRSASAHVIFPSLDGRWSITEKADERDCLEGFNTYKSTATFSDHGDTATISLPRVGTRIFSKRGCNIWGDFSHSEDSGIIEGSGSLTIGEDGNSMSGHSYWTWKGPEWTFECSGTSKITGKRLR